VERDLNFSLVCKIGRERLPEIPLFSVSSGFIRIATVQQLVDYVPFSSGDRPRFTDALAKVVGPGVVYGLSSSGTTRMTIVPSALSCITSEIKQYIGRKLRYFSEPYIGRHRRGSPSECCRMV